jgi:hypothetical protein
MFGSHVHAAVMAAMMVAVMTAAMMLLPAQVRTATPSG